ncbi:MAG: pilus assembly protein, partial [Myxococcota bacterium]
GGGGGGGGGGNKTGPAEKGLSLTSFDVGNSKLSPEAFGVANQAEADEIIQWVHGGSGTERPDVRLGDIYHSTPVVVGAPEQDLPDESFNEFRQLAHVANRPTVLYVGSNDGVLHAFAAEDAEITAGPHSGESLDAGEELWGFVPPLLIPKLDSARTSHQWMVDGTPVVKDIFYARAPGANAAGDIYHTILVVGMRGGGNGYIALDVTDPFEPEFLFQFAHPEMGQTYGAPALGQILVETGTGPQERGFVFLPGGKGNDLTEDLCGAPVVEDDGHLSKPLGCPSRGKGRPPANEGTLNARENQRCWDGTGRHLFFVDVGTGELVRQLDDRVFNAPLSGGASLFPGEVGQVASRAFITDADGVLWRIDISAMRMRDWDADPLYDLFADAHAVDGQPAYFPPVITTDGENNVVVVQGTGNADRLDGLVENRVISVTEELDVAADGSVNEVTADLNWLIQLPEGEQVTGPLDLFNGTIFFSTFRSASSTTDACRFGDSFIWGADFREADGDDSTDPLPRLPTGEPDEFRLKTGPDEHRNELIMGVAVTQAPQCIDTQQVSETDPFLGPRQVERSGASGGGQFQLVGLSSGGNDRAAGAEVSQARMDLPTPEAFTRTRAFAGTVD